MQMHCVRCDPGTWVRVEGGTPLTISGLYTQAEAVISAAEKQAAYIQHIKEHLPQHLPTAPPGML